MICMTTIMCSFHGTDSSNELPDLHATQTPASEVHAEVVTERPPVCLHKLLPREHQRDNWQKAWIKAVSNLINICSSNPIQV